MASDLDRELANLVPGAVWWNQPAPIAVTGNEVLDQALAALDRGAIEEARALGQTFTAPGFAELVLAIAERLESEHQPFAWAPERDIPALPEALRGHANLLYKQAYRAHDSRRALIRRTVVLFEDRMDAALERRILTAIEQPCPPVLRAALAGTLLGWRWDPLLGPTRKVETIASAEYLRELAQHLRLEDPLLMFAAQALLVLEPMHVRLLLARFIETTPAPSRLSALCEIARGIGGLVPFDSEPDWADLLSPVLDSSDRTVAIATLNHLVASTTPAPLLRALHNVLDDTLFETLLASLHELADASVIPELEALAAALPNPSGKVARSKKSVLNVVKRLRKLGESEVAPTIIGSVGTDGGPLILLTQNAVAAWSGASSPMWREPRSVDAALPDDDYGRACGAVASRAFAFTSSGGEPALVLAANACDCVLFDERVYFVTSGSARAVDALRPPRRRAGAKQEVLKVTQSGVLVLDASLAGDATDSERALRVSMAPGEYAADEVTSPDGSTTAVVLTRSVEAVRKPRKKASKKA